MGFKCFVFCWNESYWAMLSCGAVYYAIKVVLNFESVDEILKCDHSNESYWAVVSCDAVYFAAKTNWNISNQLKSFSTRISQVATHRGSKRVSLKAKHLGFSGQAPQKLRSKLQFQTLKHISRKEGTPKPWFQQSSLRLNLRTENLPFNKGVNKTRESCLSSHNIVHRCLI